MTIKYKDRLYFCEDRERKLYFSNVTSECYSEFFYRKTSFWVKICLWFCKPIYSADLANANHILVWKRFRGKLYLVKAITV